MNYVLGHALIAKKKIYYRRNDAKSIKGYDQEVVLPGGSNLYSKSPTTGTIILTSYIPL